MANMLWKNQAYPSQWGAPARFSFGYPTDGDLTTLTPPTHIGASWFLGMYQEIQTVITQSGLVFDPSDTTQLLAAIQALFHPSFELREDGGFELLEDGVSFELRQWQSND